MYYLPSLPITPRLSLLSQLTTPRDEDRRIEALLDTGEALNFMTKDIAERVVKYSSGVMGVGKYRV